VNVYYEDLRKTDGVKNKITHHSDF